MGRIRFPRSTLKLFIDKAHELIGNGGPPGQSSLWVWRSADRWSLPTVGQFLSEIDRGYGLFAASFDWGQSGSAEFSFIDGEFRAEVTAPTREVVEELVGYVSSLLQTGEVQSEAKEPVRVFIGHGRSPLWKQLKDHLTDIQHIDVEAYEVGSRSGFTIREVLDSMLERTSMAFLVMTAEDEQAGETTRARQNVVHEAGLFQGRLGFPRAIVLRETGVELFTNLDGIQYIEFAPGKIREAFGEVVGAIRREFPGV